MTTETQTEVHPFEARGLGKAPFRYVGLQYQEISYGERVIGNVGGCAMTTKPGGTCAYCHAYIVNMFNVESSDGNRFHVGCDCIKKVGDVKLAKQIAPALKKLKASRDAARIAAAKAALPGKTSLAGKPHPNAYAQANGKTLADYCEWLLKNGGTTGRLKAARIIESAE